MEAASRTGSGADGSKDGVNLYKRGDAVVVSLNHRLNIFGFLHLGDIGGEKYAASGNPGMLDIVLALQWVRDNIAQFGGDPENVMIFGVSGGGRKVATLMGIPAAKGLFHRAVIESGPGIHMQPRDHATELALEVLGELGLKPNQVDLLQTLQRKDLLAAFDAVRGKRDSLRRPAAPLPCGTVVDLVISDGSPIMPNDLCDNPDTLIAGIDYPGTTVEASGATESTCADNDSLDVWYSYTPADSNLISITLANSDFDTTLAVYDSCNTEELACNDDFAHPDINSQVALYMTEGATYLIRVAGYDGQSGDFTLSNR